MESRSLDFFLKVVDAGSLRAGLPAPDPVIETDVIPLKFALMRGGTYLTFHAAAHLAVCNPGFLMPLDTPEARVRRQAGETPRPATEVFIGILRDIAEGAPP